MVEEKEDNLQNDKNAPYSNHHYIIIELQFSSVTQLCLTLWDPMDCSIPGPSVLHRLLELAQTHVH